MRRYARWLASCGRESKALSTCCTSAASARLSSCSWACALAALSVLSPVPTYLIMSTTSVEAASRGASVSCGLPFVTIGAPGGAAALMALSKRTLRKRSPLAESPSQPPACSVPRKVEYALSLGWGWS